MNLVHQGEFGRMVALQGSRITSVPLSEAARGPRRVDQELYDTASVFFG
jgi:6-phosphofructokinase 1